jgi:F420-dependent oxidoreductase-like protein
MRLALMIEPQQGLSYEEQVTIALRAEAAGFEALFRSDHYQSFPGRQGRATTDAWAVLAGLARETKRIRLGTLVSPVTFRHPGHFAKLVATVDEMSGGRIEVGVGAGWHEEEHTQLGLDFPPARQRADMLEDELAMLRGLWGEADGWSYGGLSVTVTGAIFHPKPVQTPRPPIILGGYGKPRSLQLAARYADEYNMCGLDAAACAAAFRALSDACSAVHRNPQEVRRSAMVGALVGSDRYEFESRLDAQLIFNEVPTDQKDVWLSERAHWIMGTPHDALHQLQAYADAGCERIVLQDLLPRDLDLIDLLGALAPDVMRPSART